ncbi:hypothetical protein QN277_000901 [Acacia crassicarpa]|uniref:Uncharacterized protein n=1 Tax=Acacia crassicarpa TaxID=499986 RepID=A0AAE1N601_9FABA|nr:hypothetical protein QN277_000901 [Acacia crassicarpa]
MTWAENELRRELHEKEDAEGEQERPKGSVILVSSIVLLQKFYDATLELLINPLSQTMCFQREARKKHISEKQVMWTRFEGCNWDSKVLVRVEIVIAPTVEYDNSSSEI